MLKELAEISQELAHMVVAPEEDVKLPDWFLLEIVRDMPKLAERK